MADALVSVVFDILIQRVHQAIAVAVAVDHDEISNLNLHVGFDSSHRKNTALHIAARVGNKKMVEVLLSEGTPASLLTENSKHETPLHIAARSGHVHVVKFLIYWATESTDVEAGGIQQQNDSDLLVSLNNAGESPLFMAVDARASEIVKTILPKSNPYSLLHRSSDGQTILHRAILRANLTLSLLGRITQQSPPNILHVAAQNGHLKVVRYIQNMFMVNDLLNETDEDGNTPLHLAAAKLHSSIVSTLVQTGNMDTTTINKKGETVLDIARKFSLFHQVMKKMKARMGIKPKQLQTRLVVSQRTIEILKAASAKQAKKLEGILEQEDLIIESIRDKRRKEMAAPS
ncbi:Ankyrin repeat-containing protein [Vitis vinifera]|uniref:Ankyrin repeat-containing protein n=1 Tax=Vitis vinifera TaxID=29760 RepID=A0A438CQK0_VITVI|nr:Ankyrin repeat-containing protein [Vitis vinifera]